MELKRETVLFINLIYRVILLVGFLSENEAPNLPVKDPILNWNYALTERVVLILVNGLRDDFLEENVTPFLSEIAYKNGSFAKAKVDTFLTMDSALRTILTGVPGHSSLFPWNRPAKYKTILDFIACKCVVGALTLEKTPQCYYPELSLFSNLKDLVEEDASKECLYVVSLEFGGFFEDEYRTRLKNLDNDVKAIVEEVWGKWKSFHTTFVLTSSRGWSLWNRDDASVDVPVLIWGNAILPQREEKVLRLVDIPVMVSALLGRSFPAGCLGQTHTYYFNANPEAKFHMLLYNNEHFEKTMSDVEEDDSFEVRTLKDFVEDEDALTIGVSIETFLDNVYELGLKRMKYVSLMTMVSFAIWNLIFMVVVVRGAFPINLHPYTPVFIIAAATVTFVYTSQSIVQHVLLEILTPIVLHVFGDIIAAFRREGHKMYLMSSIACIAMTVLTFVPARFAVILLIFPTLLWPFVSGIFHRMNKKILVFFALSAATLACLPHFQVIGRSVSPGLIILGVLLNLMFFLFIYHSFKRKIDFQSWLIIVFALCSCTRVWNITPHSSYISWCFLLLPLASTIFLRGTLLEHHLKFCLVLLIPYQLLSICHESFFYYALASCMFSWLFMENIPDERTLLAYQPSVFSIEKPSESFTDKIQGKHYREVALFLVFTFVSFFAAGNVPSVYSYDLNIAKPFGNVGSPFLILLKFSIPFLCLVFSFVTLQSMKKREPSTLFILSLFFLDVFATCILIYAYFFDVFNIDMSHFVILEFVAITLSVLFFIVKYICS